MKKIGVIGAREATKLNPILKERTYVKEVVIHILDDNASCIGAGILNGMSCWVDGRYYNSLIAAMKSNPEGIVESLGDITANGFSVGFVLFASQLF